MPNLILSIDTSQSSACCSVADNQNILCEHEIDAPNSHYESLEPLVRGALAKVGGQIGELKGLIVCSGPGSFTGLRIGYSFVKGLSYALQIPIIEVPSLTAQVYSLEPRLVDGCLICSISDARRGEYFVTIGSWRNGKLVAINLEVASNPQILTSEKCIELIQSIVDNTSQNVVIVGTSQLQELTIKERSFQRYEYMRSGNIATGAVRYLYHTGQLDKVVKTKFSLTNLSEVAPNYVRSVAAKTIVERGRL